jgi:hypothetical protein
MGNSEASASRAFDAHKGLRTTLVPTFPSDEERITEGQGTVMPAKKAAKKAAKKMAKKFAHHRPAHDLRRAYEHLGRVDILEGALAGTHFRYVSALADLAQQQLASGHPRTGADLLRAAEHICFAALAPEDRPGTVSLVSAELKAAIADELNHLTRRAEEHWSYAEDEQPHPVIVTIYTAALDQAQLAFASGAYRPALELARAAEVLAHLSARVTARLTGGERQRLAS